MPKLKPEITIGTIVTILLNLVALVVFFTKLEGSSAAQAHEIELIKRTYVTKEVSRTQREGDVARWNDVIQRLDRIESLLLKRR